MCFYSIVILIFSQLPPAYVASDWYKSDLVVKFEDIEKYTSFSQTEVCIGFSTHVTIIIQLTFH